MRISLWAVGATCMGCAKPPVEAPQELGELGLYLFEHFADDDPAEIHAGWRNLATFLAQEDYALPAEDRALGMPVLQGRRLGGLSIPQGATPENQVAVSGSGRSGFPLDAQVDMFVDPVQTCLESSTTHWAGRQFLSDVDCFERGSCDVLRTLTEVRKDGIFRIWYDQFKDYRRFTLESDEGEPISLIAGRAWNTESFQGDTGANAQLQLFHLDVYLQASDPTQTLRWFSMWSEVELFGIGDDFYAAQIVDGLDEALLFGEEYLAGVQESCPHDRDAAKPPRP